MSLAARLGRNSAIYTVASVLQRGLSFLLLPFYTRFLRPDDFGILSVVTVLNGLFTVLFTFSLYGAITRFYFEYRDNPRELREFLGTTLTFGLVASVLLGGLTLVVGPWLLGPILKDIPFWPYVALGIVATIFQPFFLMYLHLLQTREHAFRYALLNLLNFLTSLALIIGLVVFAHLRAAGPLLASAIVALLFFCLSLYLIHGDVVFTLRRDHLRRALGYSLPLVPHNLAGQLQILFDRFVLNRLLGPAAVGLYQVGYLFGALLGVVSDAVNRAYVPVAMSALSGEGAGGLAELRELGLTLVAGFCMLAALISLWAPEGVWLLTSAPYHVAAGLVPIFAYSFAAAGIYYVFVNVLFYTKHATPFVMVGTIGGAIVSIASNLLLVPHWGAYGTAVSSVLAQSVAAVITALIGARFDAVRWPYLRIVATFLICGTLSLLVAAATTPPSVVGCVLKIPMVLILYWICNFVLWGEVRHLDRHFPALLRRVALIRNYRGRNR